MIFDNYEPALLSSLIASQATPDAIEVLGKIEPEMFNKGSFREMYKAIRSLHNKGEDWDFWGIGGIANIEPMSIADMVKNSTGSASQVKSFAKRVRQGYYLRTAQFELTQALDAINNCNDASKVGEIAESIERAIKSLVVETDKKKPVSAEDIAYNYVEVLENRLNGAEHDRRLKFGIDAIDSKTGGINPTDLVVIAGCPGMGKTELMVKLATSVSDNEKGSLTFSLEMSDTELIERAIAIDSNMSITKLRNPREMDDSELARIGAAVGQVKDKKFYVLDQAGLTIDEIFAQAVDHKARHPETNLICVDYAGLVNTSAREDHVRALGEVGKKLKELAKKIQTPVILLSQVVSKNVEQRGDKRPMASDLKGSSELQDAADWILFPYRDVVYNEDSPAANVAEIGFAKARHGTQGTVYMEWKNGHFVEAQDPHYLQDQAKQSKESGQNRRGNKGF